MKIKVKKIKKLIRGIIYCIMAAVIFWGTWDFIGGWQGVQTAIICCLFLGFMTWIFTDD